MKLKKKIKYYFEYFLLIVLSKIFRSLPLKADLIIAKYLGKIFFIVNKKHKERAMINLKNSFPNKNERELLNICKKMYENLVKVYMEFLYIDKLSTSYIKRKIRFVGEENLINALKKNKGIIIVTGHLDNWELLGTALVKNGYPLVALYHPMRNPYSDKFFYKLRKRTGMELVSMNEYLKPSLKALNENKLLGLIADQDAGSDGVFVKFFNQWASTPKGPAVFAIKKRAPVIFLAMIREKDDSHTLYISKELPVKISGNLKEDIYYNTRLWSDELEKWVRKYPEQWFWVHRKWHTKKKD